MRWAYLLQGILFLGIILIAAYALQFKKPAGDTGIMNIKSGMALSISSESFADSGRIPAKYTCDGVGISPPLVFSGVPEGAKSLVLIMDDPDVPKVLRPNGVYDHWVLFNIPRTTIGIAEDGSVGMAGANTSGRNAYAAPCPPSQYEPSEHRYIFTLYALDSELPLRAGASKQQVLDAMQGHILEQAQLIGLYSKK